MPRDGAIIFGDLEGKLTALRVKCAKCGRAGRYRLCRLIDQRGHDGRIVDFLDDVAADCHRRNSINWNDRCGAKCPQMMRVFALAFAAVIVAAPTIADERPSREITQTMGRCYAVSVKWQIELEETGRTVPVDWENSFLGCMRAYGFNRLADCPYDPRISPTCYQEGPIPTDETAAAIRALVEKK